MKNGDEQSFEIYGVDQQSYINKIGVLTAVFALGSIILTVFFSVAQYKVGLYTVAAV